ncbi:MAG: hypothetical protein PVF45_13000, partial [Anaerolineae bacterium]
GSPDPALWTGSGDLLGASTPKGETTHFSILAKFTLSLSKGEFCGPQLEDPLEIILRQAQDDFSLDSG